LKVDREVIDDLDEPSFRVALRIELYQSDQESLLDYVASIFLFEAVLPGGATDEWMEITPIELIESPRIRQEWTGDRRPCGKSFTFPTHDMVSLVKAPMNTLSREEVAFPAGGYGGSPTLKAS
jgi:hypothetical protein